MIKIKKVLIASVILLSILTLYMGFLVSETANIYRTKLNEMAKNNLEILYYFDKFFNEIYSIGNLALELEEDVINENYEQAQSKCANINNKLTDAYDILFKVKEILNNSKSYTTDVKIIEAYDKYIICLDVAEKVLNKFEEYVETVCKISRHYSLGEYELVEEELEKYKELVYEIDDISKTLKFCTREFNEIVEKLR